MSCTVTCTCVYVQFESVVCVYLTLETKVPPATTCTFTCSVCEKVNVAYNCVLLLHTPQKVIHVHVLVHVCVLLICPLLL